MAKMRIHLSGEENLARPEIILGEDSCLMMTYLLIRPKRKGGKPDKRFMKIWQHRRKQKREQQ